MSYDCKRYTNATKALLTERLGKGEMDNAHYDLLDAAHEVDRFLTSLARNAEHMRETAARFAEGIVSEGYVNSFNPATSSNVWDLTRDAALHDMAKSNFIRTARRVLGSEGATKIVDAATAKVTS